MGKGKKTEALRKLFMFQSFDVEEDLINSFLFSWEIRANKLLAIEFFLMFVDVALVAKRSTHVYHSRGGGNGKLLAKRKRDVCRLGRRMNM